MPNTPSFADLGVRPELVERLAGLSIARPTPVQVAVLESATPDRDLIVQARTGSGKTLAFGLSLLDQFDPAEALPQALIITPTRELALQVSQALRPLAETMGLRTETLTGGADMVAQLRALRAGVQLVVGTPGRIVDHLNRGTLKVEKLRTLVLDEGDQMLDLGFKDELEVILHALPSPRRTLLFSATMPADMRALAKQYMQHPETITVEGADDQHADISHVAYRIVAVSKFEALVNILRLIGSDRAMLFCRTKADTETICRRLASEGFSAGFLHGDLEQRERNRVLTAFRHGKLDLLVATEVAARGIDVPGVAHVINVDLPFNREAYVHRSGRTGRAGRKGLCINLVAPPQARHFRQMMADGGIQVEWLDVPDPETIRVADQKRLREELWTRLTETEASQDAMDLAIEVLAFQDPVLVLAKLLQSQVVGDRPVGYDVAAFTTAAWAREKSRSAPRPVAAGGGGGGSGSEDRGGPFSRFKVNLGHRDHMHPGRLVSLLCTVGGITGRQIGAIRIQNDHTIFEVQSAAAQAFTKQVAASGDQRLHVEALGDTGAAMPSSATPRRAAHGIKRFKTKVKK